MECKGRGKIAHPKCAKIKALTDTRVCVVARALSTRTVAAYGEGQRGYRC